MESITQYVERRLKLKVNRQKSAVDLAKKRRLLGFRFFGREHEIKVRIDPSARKRAKDRLRQLTSRKWGVSMEQRIEEINRYTVGWTNYYALADTPSVFEGLDEWLRRRLRQVRWKEWKRPKTKRRRPDRAGNPRARSDRVVLLAQGLLARLRLPNPLPAPCPTPTGPNRASRDSPIPTAASGMPSEPPDADPHVRWCGGRRGEPGAYPIDRRSDHLAPWLAARVELPIGALFCVIDGPTRGRPWSTTAARGELRRYATAAGVRRRFAPHQLRHAHAVELAREGVPLPVIQRQLGHSYVSTTSVYLQGIDVEEIIGTIHARRAPMMHVSAGLDL